MPEINDRALLAMMQSGLSQREMAATLGVSRTTVGNRIKRLKNLYQVGQRESAAQRDDGPDTGPDVVTDADRVEALRQAANHLSRRIARDTREGLDVVKAAQALDRLIQAEKNSVAMGLEHRTLLSREQVSEMHRRLISQVESIVSPRLAQDMTMQGFPGDAEGFVSDVCSDLVQAIDQEYRAVVSNDD